MPFRAQAAILAAADARLVVDGIEIADPSGREVVVRVEASGVCRSQLHLIHEPRATPMLLGHEASGVVMATGPGVTQVTEGDRVLVAAVPTTSAGEPVPASPEWRWGGAARHGTDHINVFTWASHTLVDERNLTRVTDSCIPLDLASILGCAAVTGCGSVVNLARTKPGDSVAVWGVGGVGLCGVIAAKALGATTIVAVDVDRSKLDLAAELGATHTVDARDDAAVEAVRDVTGGGADAVIETVGSCLVDAVAASRPGVVGQSSGGVTVLVSSPREPLRLDVRSLLAGGRSVVSSLAGDGRPQRDIPLYVEWYERGMFPLEKLVTRRHRLADVNDAVDDLGAGRVLGRALLVP